MRMVLSCIFRALVPAVLLPLSLCAQSKKKNREIDTAYYESYRDELTARAYFSRKYTSLKLTPPYGSVPEMKYKPNTTLNIGVGATYRALTLNIGIGINTFNPNKERGETKYFDLQGHLYTRKWNYDLLGQFYRGYYLPQGLATPDGKGYYVRPDLHVQEVGFAAFRALNSHGFSYQAGLVQNEWQKKSAGSVIVGGEILYGATHGDSTLAPTVLDSTYAALGIRRMHFFEIGPGIGYAYTLVVKKHFFALASISATFDFRYTRELMPYQHADKVDATVNFALRAGLGYNSARWGLSLLWVSSQVYAKGEASGYRYYISAGNYRLIYAQRFRLNHKVKKALQPINNIID